MKKVLLVFALFLCACGGDGGGERNAAVNKPVTAATPVTAAKLPPDTELEKQFADIAKEAKGKVGAAVYVPETGQNASLNGGEKFAMQSVYKLPIAMAVMKQIDAGKYKPDQEIEITKEDFVAKGQASALRDENPDGTKVMLWKLMEYAISKSDGTASDVLLRLAGGPAEVQRYLDGVGLTDIYVKNSEKEFAQDWQTQYANSATPDAAIRLLEELRSGRSIETERSKLLRDFMNESLTGPNRLRGPFDDNTYIAHKTGTSGTRNGITAATNDIGIIQMPNGKFLLIAVFVGDSPADEKTRDGVIAKIAKATWDRWGM